MIPYANLSMSRLFLWVSSLDSFYSKNIGHKRASVTVTDRSLLSLKSCASSTSATISNGSDSFKLCAALFGNDSVTSTEYFRDSRGVKKVGRGGFAPSILKRKLNLASAKGSTGPKSRLDLDRWRRMMATSDTHSD